MRSRPTTARRGRRRPRSETLSRVPYAGAMPLTRCEPIPVAGGFETGWQEVDPFDDLIASWAVAGAGDGD